MKREISREFKIKFQTLKDSTLKDSRYIFTFRPLKADKEPIFEFDIKGKV